ncbi:carboxymuconolactone decarboxylase family protein [Actinophytocola sp.]|uniref:carboxymuconolactone decarboxylase family protein n=1 Tax=Actinophytocola sp. TaxID=1872138 RepID=UPI003D6BA08F
MPHLSSLPDDAVLMDVFRAYPETSRPLLDYHEVVMRGPSPFTAGERELIAAYVSGLNACDYCHGVHTATAQACGIEAGVVPAAVADLDAAPVGERMRPVLRYAGKLTLSPSSVTRADADEVLAAGWPERTLHDTIMVCALFNFMNRMVFGHGIHADADYFETSGRRLEELGYAGLGRLVDSS